MTTALLAALCWLAPAPQRLYVSPTGNDAWSGRADTPNAARTDGPLATPLGARNAVRKLKAAGPLPRGGVTIQLAAGRYELSAPLALEVQDSGTADAPICYRAAPGATVRVIGGKVVTGWQPVKAPAVLARLDPAVRQRVRQADLTALGLRQFGAMKSADTWANSDAGLELFCDRRPMTLARWPNQGFTHIADISVADGWNIFGIKGSKVPRFHYDGDRPARWAGEPDAMVHGYWFWDWADQRYRVKAIDPATHELTLDGRAHEFGWRKGQWYYAYNLLCELDEPGEWYLDRARGLLYFLPPAALDDTSVQVSVLPNLVTTKDVSYVTLRGLTLECAQDTGVQVSGGARCQLVGCTIRNVGGWGVRVAGGERHLLLGCDVVDTGDGGVLLDGGDRRTLTPARHVADNCHIHRYGRWDPMYKPAVALEGVGNLLRHCLIHDGPHAAVLFSGNDHVIEFCEFHSVVYHSNDAGVIYAYHDWTRRGQVFRHNYLHDIYGHLGQGCNGIYLDNFISGTTVYGNVLARVRGGAGAVFVHGGRDNVIDNNVFVDCTPAVNVTTTGFWPAEKGQLLQGLAAVPYQSDLWRGRYPHLADILDDEPGLAKYNQVTRNVRAGGQWLKLEGRAAQTAVVKDNFSDGDPRFVDAARDDYRLGPDSPVWKLGFKRIPVERIGLYASDTRATWPVQHTVRPAPPAPPPPPPLALHPKARVKAVRVTAPVAAGWSGTPLALAEDPGRQPIASRPAAAQVAFDGARLHVRVTVPLSDADKLKVGGAWGGVDGAEVCFREASGSRPGPTFGFRAYPNGRHEANPETGAPADLLADLARQTHYAARVERGQWSAEWAIPLAAARIVPRPGLKLGFNLGALRTETGEWLVWAGALGPTTNLDGGGLLELP